jgi:hypothetical protein
MTVQERKQKQSIARTTNPPSNSHARSYRPLYIYYCFAPPGRASDGRDHEELPINPPLDCALLVRVGTGDGNGALDACDRRVPISEKFTDPITEGRKRVERPCMIDFTGFELYLENLSALDGVVVSTRQARTAQGDWGIRRNPSETR